MKTLHRVFAVLGMLALGSGASASEILVSQQVDGQSNYGPSHRDPAGPTNAEVADDFDLSASIDRVVAYGFDFPNHITDFSGVWVRFYASGTSGGPGALQAEVFVAADDPGLVNGLEPDGWLDITLPTAFAASGRHFVSVQPVMSTAWYRWSAHTNAPQLQPFYFRDPGGGFPNWVNTDSLGGNPNADVAFELYGTVTGAAHIDLLAETTLPRSGYIEILGSSFGSGGQVTVGGLDAPVADWQGSRIVAYVPEAASLGSVDVRVVNGTGLPSNAVPLQVTNHAPANGRALWRFRMDGPYSQVRPVIGPDGTIYSIDAFSHLYAIAPDGGLKWVVRGAGDKGVAVGADGSIYVGSESAIRAFHPDGTEEWTFVQDPRALILVGIAVGPDGNLYCAATEGMGVFSLTPGGALRWQTPNPYLRVPIDYNEIVFGDNAGTPQMYFFANRFLQGLTLAGQRVFSIEGGVAQLQVASSPAVGPDGSVHTAANAYAPNGDLLWAFTNPYPMSVFSKSTVGADGIHYYVQNLSQLFALNPDGTQRWHATLADFVDGPIVDPTGAQLVLTGSTTGDQAGFVLSTSAADGSELWRVVFAMENGLNQFVDTRARFSNDGQVAYVGTLTASGDNATSRSFVYALDASLDAPPPPPPPAPTVAHIAPPSGNAGGAPMTILGSGYVSGASVSIGGLAAAANVLDPSTIGATAPSLAPGTLNDLTVTNPDSSFVTVPRAWLADFLDVPQEDPFHAFVESIFRLGITAGYGDGSYGRDDAITRAQMAVFLLKAENGSAYAPPSCTGLFTDTPCPGPYTDWVEQLAAEGITVGCDAAKFCPDASVTRAEMAVFLLKTKHGAGYVPPLCGGMFGDVDCPSLYANWIERLAAEQITAGCGDGNYCPDSPNTRGEMAVFLTKAFALQ